jgi:hypothetical protein
VAQATTGSTANGPVFRGVTHLALDAKGRLAIPAKQRSRRSIEGQPAHPHR